MKVEPVTVHIVGAGLAGLAAAVELASRGRHVRLYEAGRHAGGRCRSYLDAELGCRIDNGNHLLLSGNHAALTYLETIGARDTLIGPDAPDFPFLDVASGERWHLRPGLGAIPWWIFSASRRVPGTRPSDYLAGFRLALSRGEDVVTDRVARGTALYRRFWQPLAVAALNTQAEEGAAQLLWAVLRESFGRGGSAALPLVPQEGLSESLVDPALRFLERAGAAIRFGARLRRIDLAGDRVASLDIEGGAAALAEGDQVVLAVPPWVASRLLPGLAAPDEFRGIVNAHYRFDAPATVPLFVGVIGGAAEWVFRKPGVLSVTISAAERWIDRPAEELAALLWADVARAYELGAASLPAWRILKEKRATFAATPAQLRRRPGARTRWRNLALAGDWTDTGLPATIEGAIRSGQAAAAAILAAPQGRGAEKRLEPAPVPTHGALRTKVKL
jgi:hydroxysqualene dehydroxylase